MQRARRPNGAEFGHKAMMFLHFPAPPLAGHAVARTGSGATVCQGGGRGMLAPNPAASIDRN